MRHLLLTALLASAAVPAIALAQHGNEDAHAEAGHGDAHGEEEHHFAPFATSDTRNAFVGGIINAVLLVLLFAWAASEKIGPALEAKRDLIKAELEEAARLKAEAEAKHAEYEARLASLDEEIDQIKADLTAAGEADRERIIKEAEEKASKMRADVKAAIERNIDAVRNEVKAAAIEQAIAAAEKALTEKTTGEDQNRLAQGYLKAVSEVAKENVA